MAQAREVLSNVTYADSACYCAKGSGSRLCCRARRVIPDAAPPTTACS
jgi:hypothetical protein